MGRCEKAIDELEKLSERTSILHAGKQNGLNYFPNSPLHHNEMLLCGFVQNVVFLWIVKENSNCISD